jgi:hypothetical protein
MTPTQESDLMLLQRQARQRMIQDPQPKVHNSNTEKFLASNTTNARNNNATSSASKVVAKQQLVLPKQAQSLQISQSAAPNKKADISYAFAWQHKARAEEYLQTHGASAIRKPLTAFLEPPMHDIVPNTGSRGDFKNDTDKGTPPDLITPLPLRTQSPNDLRQVTYPRVQTCDSLPSRWPIDKGLVYNTTTGTFQQWNVGDDAFPPDYAEHELPYCPVEADPFLPWIHDVFASVDGRQVHFVAQNKRRCQTGSKHTDVVNRLVPQASLFQPVSVKHITEQQASVIAPALWQNNEQSSSLQSQSQSDSLIPRYQLVPLDDASPDGQYTRFICRYSAMEFGTDKSMRTVMVGETLSVYPFNYEYVNFREGISIYTPKGRDTGSLLTATLLFSCPVPVELQIVLSEGRSVLSDGTPTLWLDLVPIRTSARFPDLHLSEAHIGPLARWGHPKFDSFQAWGAGHVLPHVEASGRWSNIPLCSPPKAAVPLPETPPQVPPQQQGNMDTTVTTITTTANTPTKQKPHFLSACVWASAEFRDFGLNVRPTADVSDRLVEWLEFHFMVGFDHVYLYDNTGAHTNATSLKPVADMYPDRVTWVDWPAVPCNNNFQTQDSVGERSSQFAASNSCRIRVTPYSEWIAEFGK